MACRKCDGTMQLLSDAGGVRWFWCGRCGSLLYKSSDGFEKFDPPGWMRDTTVTEDVQVDIVRREPVLVGLLSDNEGFLRKFRLERI